MKGIKIIRGEWSTRLRDPVWQFIGVAIAIGIFLISTFFTIFLANQSRNKPEIILNYSGKYIVVWSNSEVKDEIQVYYQGKPVSNVSGIYFSLTNSGNSIIRPEDYIKPIVIKIKSDGEIADAQITERSPSNLDITIEKIYTDTLKLSNSLLNPGDSVSFSVTLVNDESIDSPQILVPTGRIAGIKEIVVKSGNYSPTLFATTGYLSITPAFVFILAGLTCLLLFAILLFIKHRHKEAWNGPFFPAEIVFLSLMTSITVAWTFFFARFVSKNPSNNSWAFWMPGIVSGAILVVAFIIYLMIRLRRSPSKET
jgi:hypothetical protein